MLRQHVNTHAPCTHIFIQSLIRRMPTSVGKCSRNTQCQRWSSYWFSLFSYAYPNTLQERKSHTLAYTLIHKHKAAPLRGTHTSLCKQPKNQSTKPNAKHKHSCSHTVKESERERLCRFVNVGFVLLIFSMHVCVGHWWLSREYFFSFLFLLLLLLCGFLLCLCCLGSPLLRLLLSLQLLWLCCCMGYWLWIDRSSYIRNANRARSLRLKLVATSTVDEEQQVGTKSEKRMHVLFWLENCVCVCFLLPLKKKKK